MLKCSRELFSLEENVHYLNNAYMSPNLKSVEMAGIIGVKAKSQPYRMKGEQFFQPLQNLKRSFAKLIACNDPQHIAITPSASYGLATIAKNLTIGSKKNIVIPGGQFPSNYYVWERLAKEHDLEIRLINPPTEYDNRAENWNYALLNAIDEDTLVIACGHVHWTDGTLFDLKALRQKCWDVSAYFIIDGSQSIGALPFDVNEFQPDALVCVGYKWLFGPYSIGFAYFSERFLYGTPIEENWTTRMGSDDFKNLVNYQSDYRPGASRFSMGGSANFINVPMMQTALDQILAWSVKDLQQYSVNLISDYISAFEAKGCFIEKPTGRCNHILGVKLPNGIDSKVLHKNLKNKQIFVSLRGDTVRLATSIYNSRRDMDAFLSVLHRAEIA